MYGFLFVFGGSLAACVPDVGATVAAVNGTVDSDEMYPGVMGMFINKPEGVARCTGVLIERNLLLTARHCVSPTTPALICGSSPLGPPVTGSNILATSEVTMSTTDMSSYVEAVRVLVPPGGSDECGFDIAAVILDTAVPAAAYEPRLDSPVATGEELTAVGYGTTGSGGLGTRRFRHGMHVVCRGGLDCTVPEVQATEWMAEDGGFCRSDSGAPSFDTSGRLIGVTSKGINPCSGPIVSSVHAWAGWIRLVAVEAATEGAYPPPAWAMASMSDAGPPTSDGGGMPADAGAPRADAGSPDPDADVAPDAGTGAESAGCDVASSGGSAWMGAALLLLGAAFARRRGRR